MALLHWRKFVFFDEETVEDTELNQLVGLETKSNISNHSQSFVTVELTCSDSGRGCILLGDTNGYVYIVNKQLRVNSFRANQAYTSLVNQVPKSPIFLTCGSDLGGINPLIKIWDPEKPDKLSQPSCIRVIRANSGFIAPADVTCIECNDHLSLMVVGYDDGNIVIFHGDVTRQRRSKKSGPLKISDSKITGIVICSENKVSHTIKLTSNGYLSQNVSLLETKAYVSTENEIYHVNLSEKAFSKVLLDQVGCRARCSCLLPNSETSTENLFAVGRDNAVYFYHIDGKGPCLAFEGEKLTLYKFKSYLVILSRDLPNKVSRSNPFRDKDDGNEPMPRLVDLNIYDIKNKYIAHSSKVPEVQEIFNEWGLLFIVCVDGSIILFREKDTQTKLETLFRKNQFSLVIDLAKSLQYSKDALTEIFKHYGDHLYRKGDYDGAINQYIRTIGWSEPSYVIKKFLDSKRISNLTVYLEALHQEAQASPDHTKLLMNCYSKMRNDEQLKKFIESNEEGNIQFDVEIAIGVLRDAGSHDMAIYLAKKHMKHDLLFKIVIEDNGNSDAALDFMNEMTDPGEMAHYMKKYGRTMLRKSPEKTITMISTICQKSKDKISERTSSSNLFDVRSMSVQVYPENFFHIFVDNNDLFVKLLEQLVDGGTDFATKAVYNLLLELYLNSWRKEKDDILKNVHAEKIKKLLTRPNDRFDLDQALILCRNNRFDDGLMELYSRAKQYHLVLQYYMDQDDSLKIMKTCEDFGSEDSRLYMPALIHYSKTGDERLSQLLKIIEHNKIVPPMIVIGILLDSKRASLGSVKDYFIRFLSRLNDRYLNNENAIDHYKDDTEIVRQKIEEFENHQTVFQPSKCSACQGVLDLPSIHFLCSHSYHQNCFYNYSAENDECPICVTSNKKLLDEIGSHETNKSSIDRLDKQFQTPNDDVFNDLAKLFGYGFFK